MKKHITLIVLVLIMILLIACDKKDDYNPPGQISEFKIYYIDSKTSKLVNENYTPVAISKYQLIEELIAALRQDPKRIGYKKALPDNISIKDFSVSDEDILTINFDTSYNELKGIPEVLCRATIVKTLSQIDELEYIDFYVNGRPLMDSNGVYVGFLTDDDFIESTGALTNYKVSLYYAGEVGDALKEAVTDIYYTGTETMEELIINQLIEGPEEAGMYPVIPKGTTLKNVTTKDGICYVDFNEKFLEKIPDITDEVAIFSIVNSLVELPNINKVQFFINGVIRKTYRENSKFDGLFERNLTLIDTNN